MEVSSALESCKTVQKRCPLLAGFSPLPKEAALWKEHHPLTSPGQEDVLQMSFQQLWLQMPGLPSLERQ